MKIMVVAGASGGHIFPALSFLETLQDRHKDAKTLLVLPKAGISKQLDYKQVEVRYLTFFPVSKRLSGRNFLAAACFLKSFFESLMLLIQFRPDVAIGFGSLASVPMIVLARVMGIPTLLHEQNVIPGKANRFLAPFSTKIAISFRKTEEYLARYRKKMVFTGNPLRGSLRPCNKNEALDYFTLKHDTFTILVTGGSQGSHAINTAIVQALGLMPERQRLQVIHLAGAGDYEVLRRHYTSLAIKFRLFTFLESMQYAYSAADLVIARAGATTITELMRFKLPAILIPYPFAYQHQEANANVLRDMGAALVIQNSALEAHGLSKVLEEFITTPEKIQSMRFGYESMAFPDANSLFTETALSMVRK